MESNRAVDREFRMRSCQAAPPLPELRDGSSEGIANGIL